MKGTVVIVAVFLLLQLAAFRTVGADYSGNRCLSFDGAATYVTFGQSSNPMFESAQVTIEAWLKPTYDIHPGSDSTYGHSSGTIVARSKFTDRGLGGWLFAFDYIQGLLQFGFTYSSAGGTFDIISSNRAYWNSSSWYYVAATYDPTLPSGNMKLWVNGTMDGGQINDHNSIYYDTYPLQVGETLGNFAPFNGFIDEVRIWNVSRTATDIQNSWNRTLSNAETANPNLVGYWRFDDGSGLYAQDSSLYGNVGTLMNSPQWITPGAPIVPEFWSILLMLVLVATTSISAILLRARLRKLNRASLSEQPKLQ